MKRKRKTLIKRNPFVALAMKRKAGSHRKPNKAIRRSEKTIIQGDGIQGYSARLGDNNQDPDSFHSLQRILESD
jgi:hypothetical protein